MNKKILSLFNTETIIFRIKVSCKGIFAGNILSMGFPTELENYGNYRGWGGEGMTSTPWNGNSRGMGGLKQKCPPRGGMDIFWNYTFKF